MRRFSLIPTALAMTLAACSGSKTAPDVNALDANLMGNEADFILDPDGRPVGLPAGAKSGTIVGAEVMKAAGGALIQAPKAVPAARATDETLTLGGLAAQQAAKTPKRKCTTNLDFAADWAQRLPAGMPLYPKARITEAAGEKDGCAMRVVNFTTGAPLQEILDFYYTRALRSGYTAEHQIDGNDHMIGGTRARDDGAFIVMARALPDGGTDVDLVTNNGE